MGVATLIEGVAPLAKDVSVVASRVLFLAGHSVSSLVTMGGACFKGTKLQVMNG